MAYCFEDVTCLLGEAENVGGKPCDALLLLLLLLLLRIPRAAILIAHSPISEAPIYAFQLLL
jgi:hypothetical protein